MQQIHWGQIIKAAAITAAALVLAACGGSDSSSSFSTGVNRGVFIDSPVAGVGYRTFDSTPAETSEGTTDLQGRFSYRDGETVQFFIGSIILSEALTPADDVVTVLDITGAADTSDQHALNVARLLQSLDEDGDPSNGISISQDDTLLATDPIDLDTDKSTFEGAIGDLMTATGNTLISETEAKDNLEDGLAIAELFTQLVGATLLAQEPNNIGGTSLIVILINDDGTAEDIHTDDYGQAQDDEFDNTYLPDIDIVPWELDGEGKLTYTYPGNDIESNYVAVVGETLYSYETKGDRDLGPGNEAYTENFAFIFDNALIEKLPGDFVMTIDNTDCSCEPVAITLNANGSGTLQDADQGNAENINWEVDDFGNLRLLLSDGYVEIYAEYIGSNNVDGVINITFIAYENLGGEEHMFTGSMDIAP